MSYHVEAGSATKVTCVFIDDVVAMFTNVEMNNQIMGRKDETADVRNTGFALESSSPVASKLVQVTGVSDL